MKLTNKANITIIPKQAYFDWANDLNILAEEETSNYNSYQVEVDDRAEAEKILQVHYAEIFEEQLSAINTDTETWPQERNLELFDTWFNAYVSTMVFDLDADEGDEEETKDEQYYQQQIADKIKQVADQEKNQEVATLFWQALEGIQPKSCIVKSGMTSGESIDFTLAFEKGGDEDPFELFVKNIPEAAFRYGAIFGLNPDALHYNPAMRISNDTHEFLIFKLRKHG